MCTIELSQDYDCEKRESSTLIIGCAYQIKANIYLFAEEDRGKNYGYCCRIFGNCRDGVKHRSENFVIYEVELPIFR